MDFAEALTAEEFWGWPVEVLDHVRTLRQQAHQGTITLEEWREQDAAARIGSPAIDTAEVEKFQGPLLLDAPPEMPRDERRKIVGLLTALTSPAPDNENSGKIYTKARHRQRFPEYLQRVALLRKPSAAGGQDGTVRGTALAQKRWSGRSVEQDSLSQ